MTRNNKIAFHAMLGQVTVTEECRALQSTNPDPDTTFVVYDTEVREVSKSLMREINMLECPFCGHPVDVDDPDSIYPTGFGWEENPTTGYRTYTRCLGLPKDQWCYSVNCTSTSGGCGVEMQGDTMQEAIDKWNTRNQQK